jgi:hypothetical protein
MKKELHAGVAAGPLVMMSGSVVPRRKSEKMKMPKMKRVLGI